MTFNLFSTNMYGKDDSLIADEMEEAIFFFSAQNLS